MTFEIDTIEYKKCHYKSYENFYFFVMLIYMAMANEYTQVLCYPPSKGIWTSLVPLLLTVFLVKRNLHRFADNYRLKIALAIISLWIFFHYLKYSCIYAMSFFLFYNVIMAYIFVRIYGIRIIILYEKYITILSTISIVVWILYNLFPGIIISVFNTLFIKCSGILVANAFIVGLTDSSDFLGFRNTGFASEPGYFASFIIIALFFNLLINDYKYKNKHFLILFITLITTQSTTGYAAFGIILLLIVMQSKRGKTFLIVITIAVLPSIIALPFMRDKIIQYKSDENSIENVILMADYTEKNYYGQVFVPQRFDGFVLEFMNFTHDPILGYGVKEQETSYVNKELSPWISCSNGNIKIFSRFGLILGILFYTMLYRSGKLFDYKSPHKISLIFILLFITIGMSYEITTIPLLLSIWSLSFFKYSHYKTRNNSFGTLQIYKTLK